MDPPEAAYTFAAAQLHEFIHVDIPYMHGLASRSFNCLPHEITAADPCLQLLVVYVIAFSCPCMSSEVRQLPACMGILHILEASQFDDYTHHDE